MISEQIKQLFRAVQTHIALVMNAVGHNQTTLKRIEHIMTAQSDALARLAGDVANIKGVIPSAVAAITGLQAQIKDLTAKVVAAAQQSGNAQLVDDATQLNDLADQLEAVGPMLATAIANPGTIDPPATLVTDAPPGTQEDPNQPRPVDPTATAPISVPKPDTPPA